jgi:catechol-2,3-dioxygenase
VGDAGHWVTLAGCTYGQVFVLVILTLSLFETHLTVKHLETSVAFYRAVVGLEMAYLLPERRVAFFWIGGRGHSMLGV